MIDLVICHKKKYIYTAANILDYATSKLTVVIYNCVKKSKISLNKFIFVLIIVVNLLEVSSSLTCPEVGKRSFFCNAFSLLVTSKK